MAAEQKRTIKWTISLFLVMLYFSGLTAQAQYGGGSGTADDPYQIATAEHLILLGESPGDYDKHFILTADIDLDPELPGGKVFNKAVIARDYNDAKFRFEGTPFTGLFDGNGFTVRGLTIYGVGHLGLFGMIDSGAEVRNLGVTDVSIGGTGHPMGGLVGRNHGTVANCYSTGTINKGLGNTGGLVGYNRDGTVTNCYSSVTVWGHEHVGGLVGDNWDGNIAMCYSTGTVSGRLHLGGLVGRNNGDVSNCFWDVETSGLAYSDGGLGLTTAQMMDPQMYALIGWAGNSNWVLDGGNDYPRLAWEGTPGEPIPQPTFELDWLDGLGTVDDPYRVLDTSQFVMIAGASALWDRHFVLMADIDLSGMTWSEALIPAFAGSFNGNGFAVRGLTILGRDNLGLFGEILPGAKVYDLGLADVYVKNSVVGDQFGALAVSNKGSVSNCYSTGVVSGYNRVGGLVAVNYMPGEITGCYSLTQVLGINLVGGLVGSNGRWGGEHGDGGVLAKCLSAGAVSGFATVGGLVGYSENSVSNCYSSASVTGDIRVGGLVGLNAESVTNCYSISAVSGDEDVGGLVGLNWGDVVNCFWDMDTSGLAQSDGGTGLTTAELQTVNTFLCWWPNNAWTIDEGRDYPRLRWENKPGEPIPNPYGAGSGTQADPYLIYTAEQLNTIGLLPCELDDKHFSLMADIDLSGFSWSMAVIPTFSGSFNGNGFTVRGLTISGESDLGLFGEITSGAEVYDLGVVDVNVAGTGDQIGGLVGLNHGTVTNCYSTGTVFGDQHVGGLVGQNNGNVTNCYSTATASADLEVGGLVGRNGSNLSDCYSTGTVTGNGEVGGLVGDNYGGSVSRCYSTGTVSGDEYVGGLVGHNSGDVTYSFWDMDTSRLAQSDGGTGLTTAEMQTANTFFGWRCKNAWTIDEGRDYPRLQWENTPGEPIPNPYGGGSGTEADPYLIYSAEQLNTIGLVPCDLDEHFTLMADIDLIAYKGTDFNIIGYYRNNDYKPFTGVFDGNGHTISNFSYTSTDVNSIALFGYVDGENAHIKDLGLINPNVDAGTGSGVGSLVDYLDEGTVTGCYAQGGSVSGNEWVGGLVGYNSGTITNCYSVGGVRGTADVGGLVGYNYRTITNCYSIGGVSGDWRVGGLAGFNGGPITNCYSTGSVSGNNNVGGLVGSGSPHKVYNSFWDIETSGQITSDGGTGKTTAEMQTESTFTDAGWDFVGESVNGTDDIWRICEGTNYPSLVWQIPVGDFVCPDGITIEDFLFFLKRWGDDDCDLSNDYCQSTDLDFSGTVDEADLEILAENWLVDGNDELLVD